MTLTSPPTRTQAVLAYCLSAATTLIWIACVIPAGVLADPSLLDELATPMHREAILLVPALLLLIALPVGFTLSRREEGLIAVLSSTDAFVAFYAGIALTLSHPITGVPAFVAVGLLFVLGSLSSLEAWRAARAGRDEERTVPQGLRGARLALCVLVLMIPADFLLEDGAELASWLGPFVFVALSAAGVRLSRTGHGLRFTASMLQLLIAIHVIVTISYTLDAPGPDAIARLHLPGHLARGLSFFVAGIALLQCLALLRRPKQVAPAAPSDAPPS